MKKLLLGLIFIGFSITFLAQDTTVVQTLDFNDITKRRGWYVFPSDTNSYQKILMYYTLKCDAATTADNFPCGEWDYTTYTNLYDHQNVGAPRYLLGGDYPDTINQVNTPTYTYFEEQQYSIVYDSVISQTDYSIGTGSTSLSHSLKSSNANGKSQYLWQASELTTAGLAAGSIDKLKLDILTLGSSLDNFTIRMKHTGLNMLNTNSYEQDGFTEVYKFNTSFASTGVNDLNLTTPFIWDGVSNIVVEFCFNNAVQGINNNIAGEITSFNSGIYVTKDDGTLEFSSDFVDVPVTPFAVIDSFLTISFWAYGDPNVLPIGTYAFQAVDANNNRVFSSHLPWGNSQVYWDAGNSGGPSYDRINKVANFADFAGDWNHWAFTKDVNTGEMHIYLNGLLWHSGTNKNRTMSGVAGFKIAGVSSGVGRYFGSINDFRVWNKALDATTIQQWMYKDVDSSHPDYNNLLAYYKFDETTGITASDASINANSANLFGLPLWKPIEGCNLFRSLNVVAERPNLIFTQGDYTSHLDSVLVTDSTMNSSISIIHSGTSIDFNNTGITATPIDTIFGWEAGWMYTFDQNNNVIDSTFVNYDNQYVNEYSSTTFQLQNYVTPYGIGLNLGSDGFRWVYDVTDYISLLHDTVEISAGNQQELIDLKFIMIEGTPPRDVLNIETLWLGDYSHANIANDLVMPAVDVLLDSAASSFRIKTRTSGHAFGGFENCAEFCPKDHNVFVDGIKRFEWTNWKECAETPVIAQGGTWIYDRAGWCPGDFTDTYDHELTPFVTPGTDVSLDYGMEITAGGMVGNYRTTMQLVTYGANNFNLDASVDEIISPNDWEYRSKVNPICADPKIIIKNTGTTVLTSLTITYNVLGGTPETYTWNGSLNFLEREEVTLPINSQSFWVTSANRDVFEVSVSAPNGGADEYADNNSGSSTFQKPVVHSGLFELRITTNNAGIENSYTIKDDQGNVVMSRLTMANNTSYTDTVNLPDGCYVLDFLDSDDDGMSFFANNDGNGSIQFRAIPITWVETFNPQFGKFFKHHFIVDNNAVGLESYSDKQLISVFPNPSNDVFNINVVGFEDGAVNIEVYNAIGDRYYLGLKNITNGALMTTISLKDAPNGIYFLKIFTDELSSVRRILKQ